MSNFQLKGNPWLFNILKLQTSGSSKKFKVAVQCWLSIIFLQIIVVTTILFWICKLKKISNSCRNTYKFTYIGYFFLQQLFKEGNYLRKYCIYVSYILEVLLNFIIECSVSRQIHVKDYPWVKSQVNPPLGHISVALMWWARVQRTYSFISIPLDICCWHKIDIAHSHCCPHTLNLCIDPPHNGFQATIDFFS